MSRTQWYPQDGCWQSARSWKTDGTLGLSNHVTNNDVLALQPVEQFTSLLFTVVTQVCCLYLQGILKNCVHAMPLCSYTHSKRNNALHALGHTHKFTHSLD